MTAARFGVTLAFLCGLWSAAASAHEVGLSRGVWRPIDAHTWAADLTFSAAEAAASSLDAVSARTTLTRGGVPCVPSWDPVESADDDGVRLQGRFVCEAATRDAPLDVTMGAFDALRPGHRHLAQVFGDTGGAPPVTHVLQASAARFPIASAQSSAPSPVEPRAMGDLLWLGIEHIVLGFDHLVFLFGLVLVGGHWRDLLAVVTAFTVAHSITLGVAAFGVVSPPSALVEAAIAASIVYVGVENFFVQSAARRWRLSFAFGLVHGFGFAGALAEVGVRGAGVITTLLGFNLGVELGQLALVAVALPVLARARRSPRFVQLGVPALSGLVVVLGLWWFVERV